MSDNPTLSPAQSMALNSIASNGGLILTYRDGVPEYITARGGVVIANDLALRLIDSGQLVPDSGDALFEAEAQRYRVRGQDNNTTALVIKFPLGIAVDAEPINDDQPEPELPDQPVSLDDFYAYMPEHNYIFSPTRMHWPIKSVNARIPPVPLFKDGKPVMTKSKPVLKDGEPLVVDGKPVMTPSERVYLAANQWLDQNKPVEQMTWAPGMPEIVRDRLLIDGGWIRRRGVACFNLYMPPKIVLGDKNKAGPWLDHIRLVYPDDAEHIIRCFAYKVQNPQKKINHALVLGGAPGIGKDTVLEPLKDAVGPWNFQETSPKQMLGRFNSFLKSLFLRISEARDLGEFDRFDFYDHLKAIIAAPPDVLRIDEKNTKEYYILNVCLVVITTNHKTDGIYLPADDRRHYVAWSDITQDDPRFKNGYWDKLWAFYDKGGRSHVAAFLNDYKLGDFDSKAPPPKTSAFWAIADANRAPEEAESADVLDTINNPKAITLSRLVGEAVQDTSDWLKDRRNRRVIPHRLEKCGYVPVRNPVAKDGLWVIDKRRQAIYARKELSQRDQIEAAEKLTGNKVGQ